MAVSALQGWTLRSHQVVEGVVSQSWWHVLSFCETANKTVQSFHLRINEQSQPPTAMTYRTCGIGQPLRNVNYAGICIISCMTSQSLCHGCLETTAPDWWLYIHLTGSPPIVLKFHETVCTRNKMNACVRHNSLSVFRARARRLAQCLVFISRHRDSRVAPRVGHCESVHSVKVALACAWGCTELTAAL